jgi:hypothetical protein
LCPVTFLTKNLVLSTAACESGIIQLLFVRCDGRAKASPHLSEWISCVIFAAYKAQLGRSTAQQDQTLLAAIDESVRPGSRFVKPVDCCIGHLVFTD